MRAAIIADDLTGAADTGVQLARAGYRTAVAFRGAPVPPSKDLDAVALDTDSRAMPAGFAAKRVVEAAHAVRDALIGLAELSPNLHDPNQFDLGFCAPYSSSEPKFRRYDVFVFLNLLRSSSCQV